MTYNSIKYMRCTSLHRYMYLHVIIEQSCPRCHARTHPVLFIIKENVYCVQIERTVPWRSHVESDVLRIEC